MLFALEWIRNLCNTVANAVAQFVGNMTLPAIQQALTAHWWLLLPCLACGIILCFYGFRLHKIITGAVGAAVLGWIGWHIGQTLNTTSITVPILYTLMLVALGFFVFYIVYVFTVFPAAFLLAWACLSAMPGVGATGKLLGALVFAIVYCVLYVYNKASLSALSGALLLGLLAGGLFGAIPGSIVCGVCTLVGTLLQRVLQRRHEAAVAAERTAEALKYPFGPGQRDKEKAARLAAGEVSVLKPQGGAQ